jgi:hypothetical protein
MQVSWILEADSSYINNKILPEHIDRIRWLHGSEVWFAAQLV